MDSFCITFTLFFVCIFIFSTLCSCKNNLMLLLFISFYNALWRTAAQPRLTAKFSSWSRLSFAVWFHRRTEESVFIFNTGQWEQCEWVSITVTTIHVNSLHTVGLSCLDARRRVCVLQSKLCARCSEWWVAGGGCDPVTPATEAMPAWLRGLSTLLDLCTKALYVFFLFLLGFFRMCVSVVFM